MGECECAAPPGILAVDGSEDFWVVRAPTHWPRPPEQFSYSLLKDIEACPARWALARPSGSGESERYPRKESGASLAGRVLHASLDSLLRMLEEAECRDAGDAVAVLRAAGGISEELGRQIEVVVVNLRRNPRMHDRASDLEQSLRRHIPELRRQLQASLARVVLASPGRTTHRRASVDGRHEPLGLGLHPEVRLAPDDLPWIGWADVVRLSEESCEIVDYKSGATSSGHREQLFVYALLWAHDRKLNPAGRLADTLTLIYPATSESWAGPSELELERLASELTARASRAAAEVGKTPPPARVSPQTCRYCDVKQLCADFWSAEGQARLRELVAPTQRSVQAIVTQARSGRAWDVVIEADPYLSPGTSAVLVSDQERELRAGQVVRLIDVDLPNSTESGQIVSVGPNSEVFRLP